MNNFSLYTFRLYHYLLTARDTLEYSIQRDHPVEVYNNRKKILTENLEEGKPFGDFLKNNGENGEKIKEKVTSFVNDLYSENSTILIPSSNIVRVDRGQLVTLFDMVVGVTETLRDIIFQYLSYGLSNKEINPMLVQLVNDDEKMYRIILTMLVMRSFQESFFEFQKMMNESKGKQTPQSNYIVQNELAKMAGFLRFSRKHAHCTDNETLDLLDETLKVIEMTEGRRQRPDNKSFQEIFTDIHTKINNYAGVVEKSWKAIYQKVVEEVAKKQNSEPVIDPKAAN